MARAAPNSLLTKRTLTGLSFACAGPMRKRLLSLHIYGCTNHLDSDNSRSRPFPAKFRSREGHKKRQTIGRGRMVAAGGSNAPVVKGTAGTPLFHRVETPTQTRHDAAQQVASMEMWGAAAQGSHIPTVKAYRGALPPRRGVEFCSAVPPTPGRGSPYEARWYPGTAGVTMRQGSSHAAIPIYYIKNAQVP